MDPAVASPLFHESFSLRWKDVTAERGQTYSYRVVAVTGNPPSERPLTKIPGTVMVTNTVTLTRDRGAFKAYFTVAFCQLSS